MICTPECPRTISIFFFLNCHVTTYKSFTLTMCSLGSRLQSASVISLPSKNLRVEIVISSMLFSSISSGRGEFRYSSSFWRVFKRPRSKAIEEGIALRTKRKPNHSKQISKQINIQDIDTGTRPEIQNPHHRGTQKRLCNKGFLILAQFW